MIGVGALALGLADSALAEEGSAASQAAPTAAEPAAAVTQTVSGVTEAVDATARPVVEQATRAVAPVTTTATEATQPAMKAADTAVSQAVAPAAKSVDTGVKAAVERTRQDAERTLAPVGKAVDDTARPIRETTDRVVNEVAQKPVAQTPQPASDASSTRARTRSAQDAEPVVARASSRHAAADVRRSDAHRGERQRRTGEQAAARTQERLTAQRSPVAPVLAGRETNPTPSASTDRHSSGSSSAARHDREDNGLTSTPDLGLGGVSLAGSSSAASAGGSGPMFVFLLVGLAFGIAAVMRRLQLVQYARPSDAFSLLLERPG
jgi:hypothetical protein